MPELARRSEVVVDRVVEAHPELIVDHLTEFALDYGLQLDRRHEGEGMRFTRKSDLAVAGKELFRSGDALLVQISPTVGGSRIVLSADMAGLHRRGEEWRRGRAVRGGLLSAFFAWLGVRGLTPDVSTGDFVMFALSAMFGVRTVRAVNHEGVDRAEFEDDVHRAMAELCDRLESGDEP